MMFRIIWALYLRAVIGLKSDVGRIIEAVLEPLMFFVIWGMLYRSGIIESQVAEQFLLVNLIWAASSSLQKQASLSIMYDFWSKEFAELLRVGVSARDYLSAMLLFGLSAGIVSLLLYVLFAPILFGIEWERLQRLVWALPIYSLSALAISCLGAAVVLRFSQLYGFMAGTLLQLCVIISSPFVPPEKLPFWWRTISQFFPFTAVFEFGRSGDFDYLMRGIWISAAWLVLGITAYFAMFAHALREGKLARV